MQVSDRRNFWCHAIMYLRMLRSLSSTSYLCQSSSVSIRPALSRILLIRIAFCSVVIDENRLSTSTFAASALTFSSEAFFFACSGSFSAVSGVCDFTAGATVTFASDKRAAFESEPRWFPFDTGMTPKPPSLDTIL